MCKQAKKVAVGRCRVCGLRKELSPYSESICADCQRCPDCGSGELKAFSYICVVESRRKFGVRCSDCRSEWLSAEDLDKKVATQARRGPATICKICGGDATKRDDDEWQAFNHVNPHLCKSCTICPVCGGASFGENFDNGNIECVVCGEEFADSQNLERRLLIKKRRLDRFSRQ